MSLPLSSFSLFTTVAAAAAAAVAVMSTGISDSEAPQRSLALSCFFYCLSISNWYFFRFCFSWASVLYTDPHWHACLKGIIRKQYISWSSCDWVIFVLWNIILHRSGCKRSLIYAWAPRSGSSCVTKDVHVYYPLKHSWMYVFYLLKDNVIIWPTNCFPIHRM